MPHGVHGAMAAFGSRWPALVARATATDWAVVAPQDWAVVAMARRDASKAVLGSDFVLHGAELREWRLEVGLTQRELAARLSYSASSVCDWEHDRHRVPVRIWDQILAEIERERAKWGGRRRRLQA